MKKRLLCIIMSFSLLFLLAGTGVYGASDSTVNIYINSVKSSSITGILNNNITYVPFRSFYNDKATASAEIQWNASSGTATAKTKNKLNEDNSLITITATKEKSYITVNNRIIKSNGKNLIINGRMYIPIRVAAESISYDVGWNAAERSVLLESRLTTVGYDENDLYWLSRIINAEAGGEPDEGKIAVGNVVMNRVRSDDYPDSIYGVIFDTTYGVQFTPASSGSIYNSPSAASIQAAKKVLSGYSLNDEIIFFVNHELSSSKWFYSRTFVFKIGKHSFYS